MGTASPKATIDTHTHTHKEKKGKRKSNPNITLRWSSNYKKREEKRLTKTQNNDENGNRNLHIDNITLYIKGLNFPIKRYELIELIKKKYNLYICCLQNTKFRPRETYRMKVRRWWEKLFHANGDQNKTGVVILILDKTDFKIKTVFKKNKIT